MNQTTEGFILGITATLTGILLYLFCTYGGSVLLGLGNDSSPSPSVDRPASAPFVADASEMNR